MTDQPAGQTAAFRTQGKPAAGGKVQGIRRTVDFPHHRGKGMALQPILQRAEHICGARQVQPDQRPSHAGQKGRAMFDAA